MAASFQVLIFSLYPMKMRTNLCALVRIHEEKSEWSISAELVEVKAKKISEERELVEKL